MTLPPLRRLAAMALATSLFAGIALAGPVINGHAGPPRTVFLALPPDRPAPDVALRVTPLPGGGWRVALDTTGFVFTDVCVQTAEARPMGHAHLIVDGVKVASAYAPTVDLAPLPPGVHRIEAILRGQDHRALLGPMGLIKATAFLTVPAPGGR
ncbi:hypothetical protein [Roseivivax isoporae]|nr:hypothetical protein [Roseivivax isoporae]